MRARWLFPDDGPPIHDGIVTIVDGRIESISHSLNSELSVSASTEGGSVQDLGNVALIPSLVNAHTHLEFSDLDKPIGIGRDSFADWLRHVLQQRTTRIPNADESAIRAGLTESLAAGVTCIGEISTSADPFPTDRDSPIGGVRFFEMIGISADRRAACLESAEAFLQMNPPTARWRHGLSPHAPYTTSLKLVEDTVKLACEYNAPVAMHLAETKEELQLLATHDGPLRELLDERSVFDASAFPTGARALDYLQRLAKAPQSLIVHGNYLEESELRFLADHADRMTLVYCPRTHSYFQHDAYPLERAMDLGVRIALGTDSRASNPDLSLFGEIKHAAKLHPNVSREALVRAATDWRLFGRTPGFTVGHPVMLTSVRLTDTVADDPFETLLASASNAFRVQF